MKIYVVTAIELVSWSDLSRYYYFTTREKAEELARRPNWEEDGEEWGYMSTISEYEVDLMPEGDVNE